MWASSLLAAGTLQAAGSMAYLRLGIANPGQGLTNEDLRIRKEIVWIFFGSLLEIPLGIDWI